MAQKKVSRKYTKPKIKSSKIKTISLYSNGFVRNASDTEYLAGFVT